MEYDRACGEAWYAALSVADQAKISLHYGDQSKESDLLRVLSETGHASFDVVIDDGGHGMTMQQVSLKTLFPFVAPGGVYIIEDLLTSYTSYDDQPTTVDALKMVLDWMHGDPRLSNASNKHGLLAIMPDLEHMDCYPEMCVFQKFSEHDMHSAYLERPVAGQTAPAVLDACHPSSGLESRAFVYRSRLQNQGEVLDYTGKPFLRLCHQSNTDKCHGAHTYQYGYNRYLSGLASRPTRLFEIGLGCGQSNLGASFRLWTSFFKSLDLHVMEYDRACGEAWYAALSVADQAKISLHYGDQSKESDLLRVLSETGHASFDVVIDDGGHGMTMQQVSLKTLFPFVAPGGVYIIEDLLTSYTSYDDQPTTVDALKMVLDWMHGDPRLSNASNKHGLLAIMPDLEHMDCYPEMCVFQKFSEHDMHSAYLERPVAGQTAPAVLDACHPSSGLESRAFVYRSRLQNQGEVLDYTGKPFLRLCHQSNTDKCHGAHTYQYGYNRYLGALEAA